MIIPTIQNKLYVFAVRGSVVCFRILLFLAAFVRRMLDIGFVLFRGVRDCGGRFHTGRTYCGMRGVGFCCFPTGPYSRSITHHLFDFVEIPHSFDLLDNRPTSVKPIKGGTCRSARPPDAARWYELTHCPADYTSAFVSTLSARFVVLCLFGRLVFAVNSSRDRPTCFHNNDIRGIT